MSLIRNTPVYIFILLLYALLLSVQGIDFCDAGWQLTSYENILRHPEETRYSFMFWLSVIAGHFWQSLNPSWGLYWSKIGMIILFFATFFIYKKILRSYSKEYNWLPALGILFLFVFKGGPESMHYEVMTMFTVSLIVFFLYFGLTRKKKWYLLLFGFFVGINIFLKVSNLTYVSLIGVIIYFAYKEKWEKHENFQFLGFAILGLLIGVTLILGAMTALGHLELFFENLLFVKNMAASDTASHGLVNLTKSYISGYGKMALLTATAIAAYWGIQRITSAISMGAKLKKTILGLSLVLFFFTSLLVGNPVWSKVRYIFFGLMLLVAFLMLFSKKTPNDKKILLLTGVMILILAPIGSDSGLGKLTWGSWLLGALLIFHLESGITINFPNRTKKILFKLTPHVFSVAISALFISFVTYAWNNPYNDPGSRLEKIYPIRHPKLRFIYTTEERANFINEMLEALSKYVAPDEDLLAFNSIPMVHYLTGTKPFLSTSWVKLLYADKIFAKELHDAVEKKGLPVVIRQKTNTGDTDWSLVPPENYTAYLNPSIKYKSQGIILNKMLKKYNYQTVWENKIFEILMVEK